MGVKLLNQEEADRLAVAYLETGNRQAAYHRFNPQAHKLKNNTIRCNVSQLFAQASVKHTIAHKSNVIVSAVMSKLNYNLESCIRELDEAIALAMSIDQPGAATTAIKAKASLMKLDQIVEQKGHVTVRDYGSTQLASTPKVAKIK